ncbi:MAG: hypothetical protein ACJ72V_20000 [Nitrososphaeraceae archaeon]
MDPIDSDREAASQRSEIEKDEITGSVEEKLEGLQESSGGRNPGISQK